MSEKRKSPHGSGTPCPRCHSTKTKKNGYNIVKNRKIPRHLCDSCGMPFDSRTLNEIPRCECGMPKDECDGHANWFGEPDEILRSVPVAGHTLNLHNFL